MSPTINNYYNQILLSNIDENKEKISETPFKIINNEMDWYGPQQIRNDIINDSPLFPRNLSINYFFELKIIHLTNINYI